MSAQMHRSPNEKPSGRNGTAGPRVLAWRDSCIRGWEYWKFLHMSGKA